MGEVRSCDDRRIGREVAMKSMRPDATGLTGALFLQEARVQARLEHPSIVPVYDVGLDRSGAPYFTMKRVRGRTLKTILRGLRGADPDTVTLYSRRRLLTAFTGVCLAVHYAHTKDVLHLDLKPTNVMLDEFGALYVLDWGLAQVESRNEASPDSGAEPAIAGTPQYMAPEQLVGGAVDARSDVYALGAILFEILCLEPLHMTTLRAGGTTRRPSTRAPERDIPPELDEICARATADAPEDRYPTVRGLHDAVDRYLEGDRDLVRRRALSEVHAENARIVAADAFRADDEAARTRALREVSLALAFDPENLRARRVLVELLTAPPRTLPREAREEVERGWHLQRQRMAKGGAFLFLVWFFFTPVLLSFVHYHSLWVLYLQGPLVLAAVVALLRTARTPFEKRTTPYATVIFSSLAIASQSAHVGSLCLVPTLVIATMVAFLLQPERSRRPLIVAMSVLAIVLPLVLEWIGVVPPAYVFAGGVMTIQDRWYAHTEGSFLALVAITLGLVVGFAALFIRLRDQLTDAETRLSLQAWQLRQLVPSEDEHPR
jgi:serine/threonine-protein kinase